MSAIHQPTLKLYKIGKQAADIMEAGRHLPGEKFFLASYDPAFAAPPLPEIPDDVKMIVPNERDYGYRNRSPDGFPQLAALLDAYQYGREKNNDRPDHDHIHSKGKNYIIGHSINSDLLPRLFQVYRDDDPDVKGLFKPNDEVLVCTPIYGMLPKIAYTSNLNIIAVPAAKKDGYKPTREGIEAALKAHPNARALLIVNPNNPTGTMLNQAEIDGIAEVIGKHNEHYHQHDGRPLFVIEDTTFMPVRWNRVEKGMPSPGERQSMGLFGKSEPTRNLTIALTSWSKSMEPDWGLATASGHPDLLEGMRINLHDGAARDSQEKLFKAMHPHNRPIIDAHMQKSIAFYKRDYDILKQWVQDANDRLKKQFGDDQEYISIVTEPKAGFHVAIDFSGLKDFSTVEGNTKSPPMHTSQDFAVVLMNKTNVIAYPGEMFYIPGEDMVLRLSLNVEPQKLQEGLKRIEKFCMDLALPSKWVSHHLQRNIRPAGDIAPGHF